MGTVTARRLVDQLIASDGYYEDDPRAVMIVEYTNAWGEQAWGITWSNESPERQRRYLQESQYIHAPRVLWQAE